MVSPTGMITIIIHKSIAGHVEEGRKDYIEKKVSTMEGGHLCFRSRKVVFRKWFVFRAFA
jgi:hypothetical protein